MVKPVLLTYKDTGQRTGALATVSKVVVKVGTRLLTDMDEPKMVRVRQLVDAVARLRGRGLEVVLVTSGAIGAGMSVLGTTQRPRTIPDLQAHAAVGQSRLMYLYEMACVEHGFHCAQLLLTAADVQDRERHLNVTSCLNAMLSMQLLPVINENDSVAVDEIRFGDNDVLAALVAAMIRADLTILLTTVDGMQERVADGALGARISVVEEITPELNGMAGDADGNRFSVGGMVTKLRAADIVTKSGEPMWIADGRDFGVLDRLMDGADVGTFFCARGEGRMRSHKRYLAFFSEPCGEVVIDAGAVRALTVGGKSLLPGGIVAVSGEFRRGDTVRIVAESGDEVARGVSNYASTDVGRIRGCRSPEIRAILGDAAYDEVVHRDYMVLTG